MDHVGALMMALDLLHVPSRVRLIRSVPLPDGVVTLLRIADGDEALVREAAAETGTSPAMIREAANFFIEQALLHPGADAYRVLGARPEASTAELRRNMALLVRWLHPDHQKADRSVFTHRVTQAWNELKTDERRRAYDRSRVLNKATASRKSAKTIPKRQTAIRWSGNTPHHAMRPHPIRRTDPEAGLLRRVLLLLLGRPAH